jgi:hypothetical protein
MHKKRQRSQLKPIINKKPLKIDVEEPEISSFMDP